MLESDLIVFLKQLIHSFKFILYLKYIALNWSSQWDVASLLPKSATHLSNTAKTVVSCRIMSIAVDAQL